MSGVCERHGEYVQPGGVCRWCEVPASGPGCWHGYRCAMGCVQIEAPAADDIIGQHLDMRSQQMQAARAALWAGIQRARTAKAAVCQHQRAKPDDPCGLCQKLDLIPGDDM